MTVDPSDDCTFWFTTEYYAASSTSGWTTRIGSVTFPECLATTGTNFDVGGRVTDPAGRGLSGVRVKLEPTGGGQIRFETTGVNGNYSFPSNPGNQNYIVSVIAKRYTFTPQMIFLSGNMISVNFTGSK